MGNQGLLSPITSGLPLQTRSAQPTQKLAKKLPPATDDEKQSERREAQSTLSSGETMKAIADLVGIGLSSIRVSFSPDKDTGETLIKVIDNQTNEVVRQIPPEELMRLKKRLEDLQGLLVDKKA